MAITAETIERIKNRFLNKSAETNPYIIKDIINIAENKIRLFTTSFIFLFVALTFFEAVLLFLDFFEAFFLEVFFTPFLAIDIFFRLL